MISAPLSLFHWIWLQSWRPRAIVNNQFPSSPVDLMLFVVIIYLFIYCWVVMIGYAVVWGPPAAPVKGGGGWLDDFHLFHLCFIVESSTCDPQHLHQDSGIGSDVERMPMADPSLFLPFIFIWCCCYCCFCCCRRGGGGGGRWEESSTVADVTIAIIQSFNQGGDSRSA